MSIMIMASLERCSREGGNLFFYYKSILLASACACTWGGDFESVFSRLVEEKEIKQHGNIKNSKFLYHGLLLKIRAAAETGDLSGRRAKIKIPYLSITTFFTTRDTNGAKRLSYVRVR